MSPEAELHSLNRRPCVIMFGLCGAGADGSGPPGGSAIQPHPKAHCRNQLPVCGPHSRGHGHTTGHSAAAGAGIRQTQTRTCFTGHNCLLSVVLLCQSHSADAGCVYPQGLELCRVIAMQVENMMSLREKRLTLPPSEITML